jgi:hypothetical protein
MIIKNEIYFSQIPLTLATWAAKSRTLLLYPHSLSYHEIILWKFPLKPIPALASKIDDLLSCIKSYETTSSVVYPKIPLLFLIIF